MQRSYPAEDETDEDAPYCEECGSENVRIKSIGNDLECRDCGHDTESEEEE